MSNILAIYSHKVINIAVQVFYVYFVICHAQLMQCHSDTGTHFWCNCIFIDIRIPIIWSCMRFKGKFPVAQSVVGNVKDLLREPYYFHPYFRTTAHNVASVMIAISRCMLIIGNYLTISKQFLHPSLIWTSVVSVGPSSARTRILFLPLNLDPPPVKFYSFVLDVARDNAIVWALQVTN